MVSGNPFVVLSLHAVKTYAKQHTRAVNSAKYSTAMYIPITYKCKEKFIIIQAIRII